MNQVHKPARSSGYLVYSRQSRTLTSHLALQPKHALTLSVTVCIIPLAFFFVKCRQTVREQSTAVGCVSISHNDSKYHICMYFVAVTILTLLYFNTVRCHAVSVDFLRPQLIIRIASKFRSCEEQSSYSRGPPGTQTKLRDH
jgi:hypothetical protein